MAARPSAFLYGSSSFLPHTWSLWDTFNGWLWSCVAKPDATYTLQQTKKRRTTQAFKIVAILCGTGGTTCKSSGALLAGGCWICHLYEFINYYYCDWWHAEERWYGCHENCTWFFRFTVYIEVEGIFNNNCFYILRIFQRPPSPRPPPISENNMICYIRWILVLVAVVVVYFATYHYYTNNMKEIVLRGVYPQINLSHATLILCWSEEYHTADCLWSLSGGVLWHRTLPHTSYALNMTW